MKRFTCYLSLLILTWNAGAQEFEIRKDGDNTAPISIPDKLSIDFYKEAVSSLFIKCITPENAHDKFFLFVDSNECKEFTGNQNKMLQCAGIPDLRDKKLEIRKSDKSTPVKSFTLLSPRSFDIKLSKNGEAIRLDEENKSAKKYPGEIAELFISHSGTARPAEKYTFVIDDKPVRDLSFAGDGETVSLSDGNNDLRGKNIAILDQKTNKQYLVFFLQKDKETDEVPQNPLPETSAIDEIKKRFPFIATTPFGLQIPAGNQQTAYTGSKYIHIFLDQFGNNVFSTIPQGISNRQYVVHIFFLQTVKNPNTVDYSVNQTAGEFQDALVFNNAGQANKFEFRSGSDQARLEWAFKEFLLSTSTTNIQFDVVRTAIKDPTALKSEFETQILRSYTIKMSKVYHGSFDIGLLNTTLKNPAFEQVTSPADPTQKVVKQNDGSNRGVVTVMATFYTSPIILLESLLGSKNIPNYKLSGRNFLEDHKIYERIYPAVGVGFTDKTLENLFFGADWEFARGGSIFLGWHYGKVNIYKAPPGFQFEKTPVSDNEFNLYKNSAWKTSFAFGLNLDIMIIRNLFRAADAGTGANQ